MISKTIAKEEARTMPNAEDVIYVTSPKSYVVSGVVMSLSLIHI